MIVQLLLLLEIKVSTSTFKRTRVVEGMAEEFKEPQTDSARLYGPAVRVDFAQSQQIAPYNYTLNRGGK